MEKDFLGSYSKFISKYIVINTLKSIIPLYSTKRVFPNQKDVFKAFHSVSYKDLRVVILGQDPYPQPNVATGLAFANRLDTKDISPSLRVLIENINHLFYSEVDSDLPFECDYVTGREFDITLESWAKQGVLLLNSALTVEAYNSGSHFTIWYDFMKELLSNLSHSSSGIIYILFGEQAGLFKPYINSIANIILDCNHPAYYARENEPMRDNVFKLTNNYLSSIYNEVITW